MKLANGYSKYVFVKADEVVKRGDLYLGTVIFSGGETEVKPGDDIYFDLNSAKWLSFTNGNQELERYYCFKDSAVVMIMEEFETKQLG